MTLDKKIEKSEDAGEVVGTYFAAFQGFVGQGKRDIHFRRTWEKGQIFRGAGEQRQYLGTRNIRYFVSTFGVQGNKPIYFRGTREQVPPGEALS